ncbi:MAG: hypothetical protein AB8B74_02365 [Crocinitomicaceae bacterium]
MNKTNILLWIFFISLAYGCTTEKKQELIHIDEKEYLNGFLGNSKMTKVNGKTFLCHYDLVTNKKIIAESLEDDEKHIIDLSEVILMSDSRIKAFEIIDWNTIYLLPIHSTHLLVANGEGQHIKTLNLSPYLEQEGQFELVNWTGSFVINDTSMIFPLEFRPESLPLTMRDSFEAYDSARYTAPRLFKIDNFLKDSLSVHFGASHLYQRFVEENVLAYDKSNFRFINGQIIYSSMYTDSIYLINPITLKVTASYKIQSDYTGLIIKHITRQEFTNSGQNLLMYNAYSNGNINDIFFDHISQNYFVSVFHKPEEENQSPAKLEWSFIVLDQTFNKIDEIKMNADLYNQNCYSTNNGLYLAANMAHKNDTNYYKKNNYSIFKYE